MHLVELEDGWKAGMDPAAEIPGQVKSSPVQDIRN